MLRGGKGVKGEGKEAGFGEAFRKSNGKTYGSRAAARTNNTVLLGAKVLQDFGLGSAFARNFDAKGGMQKQQPPGGSRTKLTV